MLRRPHLRIAGTYLLVAVAYILISDQLVFAWAEDPETLAWIGTVKGIGFVVITAGLLFFLVRASFRRLQAEVQRAEASKARFRSLVEHAPEAIAVLEAASSRVALANASCGKLFGRSVGQLEGDVLCEHLSERPEPSDGCLGAVQRAVSLAAEGSVQRLECWATRPGHEAVPCQLSVAPLDEDGSEYVAVWLTDLRKAREREGRTLRERNELARVDRLVTLGTLVASIAHELNNPLNYVRFKLASLEQEAEGGRSREQQEIILGIRDGIDRILALSAQLTDFVRSTASPPDCHFDLNEVVDNCIRLTRAEIQQRTRSFEVLRMPGLPGLPGDPRRIEQAVMNLILNALQALPNRDAGVRLRTFLDAARDEIGLVVEDDGEGVDAEYLARIREPFFTTKAERGGTGLGLAVVVEVVEEAGGQLEFESEAGRGTRATLRFPIQDRARAEEAAGQSTSGVSSS